ncbi:hypothetical protein C7974DRAFT_314631 [Boeremia exigua]|uniref:uncharacterized protein n=1 Tax=Boeremia exigua TaxID=749465 RepID=UPI001E8CD4DF|nr:uncharacterized protein C7974DRAFT_314631 [Boeremia exigua]KAH6622017.1 hypothetical protein C7974DRAFT_314631 [Boeremia exigua]
MEPVSAVFSIMAALPQCIQSAKQLYDLRERYKDASMLITAIYSESMVIAASLSQVQNLLQNDSLLRKPLLLETFDRALTGCRIVYGALEEEVRDLVEKAQRNDLKFKDRAKYLWKEDTFKELLTQIRGQQSALSLLIQGLQMESMSDIRKLVEDNSDKLDQVVKRSKTLRQTHPRIMVPESIFMHDSGATDVAEAQSVVKSAQFEFDDQVVNSKAYQRAMARYTLNATDLAKFDLKNFEATETEVGDGESTEIGTIQGPQPRRNSLVAARSEQLVAQITSGSEIEDPMVLPKPTQDVPKSEVQSPGLRLAHQASHVDLAPKPASPGLRVPRPVFRSSEMHAVWLVLVEAERNFFDRMTRLRKSFYDNVVRQWPALEPHLGIVLIGEKLAATNKKLLWLPMEQQLLESDQAVCDPTIFETWTTNIQRMFRGYCQALPHALGALRATQNSDSKFTPFVNTLGLSLAYFGKSWEDYLKLPIVELDLCIEKMQSFISIAAGINHMDANTEVQRLTRALEALSWLKSKSAAVLEQSQSQEDLQNLERRIHAPDADIMSRLKLRDASRRVRYQGVMTMKFKSKGPWYPVHVVLLDNFLFWGGLKPQKKGTVDKLVVSDEPIHVKELEILLPSDQLQFQKATMFDEVPRNSIQYILMIRRMEPNGKAHMLGSPTYQERKAWVTHLEAATGTKAEVE